VSDAREEPPIDDLQLALDRNDGQRVAELLHGRVAPEAAKLIEALPDAEHRLRALQAISDDQRAAVFSYLPLEDQQTLTRTLTGPELRAILAALPVDDRTALVSSMAATDGGEVQRLLDLLEPTDVRHTQSMLAYPDASVGRRMSPDYLSAMADWTVHRALQHFRAHARDAETSDMVYIVDQQGRLVDDVPLRRFVLASPAAQVRTLMDMHYVSLAAEEDQERAVELMMDYDLVALPVVDAEGHLLGIVTIDDVFDIAEAEATEDIHKGVAVVPLGISYRRASVFTLFQRRFYWLALLVVVNLASSGIIAAYEEVLEAAITLAFFIPLLIDSGAIPGPRPRR
jgi:magnesium transporter